MAAFIGLGDSGEDRSSFSMLCVISIDSLERKMHEYIHSNILTPDAMLPTRDFQKNAEVNKMNMKQRNIARMNTGASPDLKMPVIRPGSAFLWCR